MRAHNVTPGMIDYKYSWTTPGGARTFSRAVQLQKDATDVLASLRIDKARAQEELDGEWTTSMELAETLQHQHRIPFRVGHHFASEVVLHARANNLMPRTFPYADAVRIYAEAGKKYQVADTRLPLDEAAFRRTLLPETMVRTRVGIGGPQPDEVRRMLGEARQAVAPGKDSRMVKSPAQSQLPRGAGDSKFNGRGKLRHFGCDRGVHGDQNLLVPNVFARDEDTSALYRRMGLNSRQIEIVATAIPKRQYYYSSEYGHRLYDLALGPLALAFVGSSDKESIAEIRALVEQHGEAWTDEWLERRGLTLRDYGAYEEVTV